MPIYSYKCEKCGKVFDKFQKASEDNGNNNVKCIYCNSGAHKLFSPVGIIFKGSGFYTTDYKSNSMNLNNNSSGGRCRSSSRSASPSEGGNLKKTKDKTFDNKETSKKETSTAPDKTS